jgi:hypothetical protein
MESEVPRKRWILVMRLVPIIACWASLLLPLQAATLERLSLDEMIEKSTAIIRGRVVGSGSGFDGVVIYTRFTVQVLEKWKGPDVPQVEVVVPGGTASGLRQTFSGTPRLAPGNEYVFFLWTGRSGLTHVIGLSQGVFDLKSDGDGGMVAFRTASTEAMLDTKTGQVISDESLRMRLRDLRARVASRLAGRTIR